MKNVFYLAMFNFADEKKEITADLKALGLEGKVSGEELWTGRALAQTAEKVCAEIPEHGAVLYRLEQ